MSVLLSFAIAPSLREALDVLKTPLSTKRAAIVVIENETLVLHKEPIEASVELTHDLTAVRKVIKDDALTCCFVIVKLEEGHFAMIMLIPEGTKPKTKMQYAGSSAHLREQSRLAIPTDTHVVCSDEINPTLFGRDIVAEREVLMTDNEKVKVELSKMEVAPQKPQGLPGVANPLDDDALIAVQEIKLKKITAATFVVTAKGISVEKKAPLGSDWVAIISEVQPRFAVINWKDTENVVLLYVCPDGCKPKEKMPYASTKASFVEQLAHQGVKPRKSVETGAAAGCEKVVEEALNAPHLEDDVKPIAPKPVMAKGPRMLIP